MPFVIALFHKFETPPLPCATYACALVPPGVVVVWGIGLSIQIK